MRPFPRRLYAELAEHVAPESVAAWAEVGGARWAKVAGILDLALDRDADEWRPRLKTLFEERRNPAVHPKAKFREPAKHPARPTKVAAEYAIYTVEALEESLDLLLEILSACVDAPERSIHAWADDTRTAVEPGYVRAIGTWPNERLARRSDLPSVRPGPGGVAAPSRSARHPALQGCGSELLMHSPLSG